MNENWKWTKEGLVNEHGQRIALNGHPVDENGDFIVEDPQPFLDEDGNPLEETP